MNITLLSGNDVIEDILEDCLKWIVKSVPNLQSLLLDDNDLGSAGVAVLAESVGDMKSLNFLSCCSCDLDNNVALNLAKLVLQLFIYFWFVY